MMDIEYPLRKVVHTWYQGLGVQGYIFYYKVSTKYVCRESYDIWISQNQTLKQYIINLVVGFGQYSSVQYRQGANQVKTLCRMQR